MKPTIDLFRMLNNKPTQHELLADRKKVFVVKCYCRKTTLFEKKNRCGLAQPTKITLLFPNITADYKRSCTKIDLIKKLAVLQN